jgi:uncharacterized protein YkwD
MPLIEGGTSSVGPGDEMIYVINEARLIHHTVLVRRDERLMRAALAKATDMVERDYITHLTPESHGGNWFARQEGYPLPADWPDDRNYIESIYVDGGSPQEVLGAFLASPSHRAHLLGLDGFARSTDIGDISGLSSSLGPNHDDCSG